MLLHRLSDQEQWKDPSPGEDNWRDGNTRKGLKYILKEDGTVTYSAKSLHRGGGPQVGEVTHLGGATCLSI